MKMCYTDIPEFVHYYKRVFSSGEGFSNVVESLKVSKWHQIFQKLILHTSTFKRTQNYDPSSISCLTHFHFIDPNNNFQISIHLHNYTSRKHYLATQVQPIERGPLKHIGKNDFQNVRSDRVQVFDGEGIHDGGLLAILVSVMFAKSSCVFKHRCTPPVPGRSYIILYKKTWRFSKTKITKSRWILGLGSSYLVCYRP